MDEETAERETTLGMVWECQRKACGWLPLEIAREGREESTERRGWWHEKGGSDEEQGSAEGCAVEACVSLVIDRGEGGAGGGCRGLRDAE